MILFTFSSTFIFYTLIVSPILFYTHIIFFLILSYYVLLYVCVSFFFGNFRMSHLGGSTQGTKASGSKWPTRRTIHTRMRKENIVHSGI